MVAVSVLCTACTIAGGQGKPPPQAVHRAADAAANIPPGVRACGVSGMFDLRIQPTDAKDGTTLNSERDDRDQRNLTIVISCDVTERLRAKYGTSPQTFSRVKHIKVTGLARRATGLSGLSTLGRLRRAAASTCGWRLSRPPFWEGSSAQS